MGIERNRGGQTALSTIISRNLWSENRGRGGGATDKGGLVNDGNKCKRYSSWLHPDQPVSDSSSRYKILWRTATTMYLRTFAHPSIQSSFGGCGGCSQIAGTPCDTLHLVSPELGSGHCQSPHRHAATYPRYLEGIPGQKT